MECALGSSMAGKKKPMPRRPSNDDDDPRRPCDLSSYVPRAYPDGSARDLLGSGPGPSTRPAAAAAADVPPSGPSVACPASCTFAAVTPSCIPWRCWLVLRTPCLVTSSMGPACDSPHLHPARLFSGVSRVSHGRQDGVTAFYTRSYEEDGSPSSSEEKRGGSTAASYLQWSNWKADASLP